VIQSQIDAESTRQLQNPQQAIGTAANVAGALSPGGALLAALGGPAAGELAVELQAPKPYNPLGRDTSNPFGEVYREAARNMMQTGFHTPRTQRETLNVYPALDAPNVLGALATALRSY
jgi:hypothetical protein